MIMSNNDTTPSKDHHLEVANHLDTATGVSSLTSSLVKEEASSLDKNWGVVYFGLWS